MTKSLNIQVGQLWFVSSSGDNSDIELWIILKGGVHLYYTTVDSVWQTSMEYTDESLSAFFVSHKFKLLSDLGDIADAVSTL